jgi:transaldolase/glucose-6-phosphate isomerase
MTKLEELAELGQSIWLDYIRRNFIVTGELDSLIRKGLRGLTSNPSIFEKAISGSNDYDNDIEGLLGKNLTRERIYEKLAFRDIEMAADMFKPAYKATKGYDGFVSIEINPEFAYKTKKTIEEGKRIFSALKKPNVFVKVPATERGIPAMTELIGSGINVNVTLIFSTDNYKEVAEAYIKGLELLRERGGDISSVASVASFFVSRIDTAVDKELDKIGNVELKGKIGIANSVKAYNIFKEIFLGERWESLAKDGAKVQRVLWASTSTKNPHYPDTLYVDGLIGKDTVNTLPPTTLNSFLDHGKTVPVLDKSYPEAAALLKKLKEANINLDKITSDLQKEGVKKFADSFTALKRAIKEKTKVMKNKNKFLQFYAGDFFNQFEETVNKISMDSIVEKIWAKDYKLWSDKPDEITNRLGWLRSPEHSLEALDEINELVVSLRKEKFRKALLLGMGGSSLAPEVFRRTFGVKYNHLDLEVLSSTHPEAVIECSLKFNPENTLYIVSTKSGGTVETLSFMKYFYNQAVKKLGKENAGKHFIAITDPDSGLEKIAKEHNFRKIFLNDPNIGGRYSALSYFGIVPAALIGVEVEKLLNRAEVMVSNNESANSPLGGDNSAAKLGAFIGEMARIGKNKITFILPEKLKHFGIWIEQLIAESTGKSGKGILPVVGEEILAPENYSNDRQFVYMKLINDTSLDEKANTLRTAGHPLIEIILKDLYDLGGEFFRWEMATSIAGWRIGIQPFNQPNVESAKVLARKMVKEYSEKGKLPETEPSLEEKGIKVYSDLKWNSIKQGFNEFLNNYSAGEPNGGGRSYISLQAYLKPDDKTTKLLQELRTKIQRKNKMAVTEAYGPGFLHSTGQLHKGDAGHGLFIQFIDKIREDAPIPDEMGNEKSSMSFGVLIHAQALGDKQALIDGNRKVIIFDLGDDISGGLKLLNDSIE